MNPIFDTALLKHHKVTYAPKIDRDATRRRVGKRGYLAQTLMILIAAGLVIGALSGATGLS